MPKSKAAVAYEVHRDMEIEMIDVDPPQAGEVLVEIKATGLCHSDLHALEGTWAQNIGFPGILGHEGAGIVAEVGRGVTSVKPGDHVVTFLPHCGQCPICASHKTNLCAASFVDAGQRSRFSVNGRRAHPMMGLGTFTNYSVVPAISLVKVRDDAPFDQVCYFACGASTGLGSALYVAKVTPGSSVIVFGAGGIGLNVVQGAKLAGAKTIIAVDTSPAKEAIARRMGATDFVNPNDVDGDLIGHLNTLTGGGADFTFEAVGNVRLILQALAAAHFAWGVCTVIGIAPEADLLQFSPMMLATGRKVTGAPMGGVIGPDHIPHLVDEMMDGRIDLGSLITSHLPIEEINDGFAMMKRHEGVRSVVTFS